MDLAGPRAVLVSGKGGTGKTTVPTALAIAATRRGRSVLLAELEGRQGVARLLGLPEFAFAERETPLGFSVTSVTPREAILEWLGLFYGMGRLAGPLLRSRALEALADGAPGFRDMMLTGKIYEAAQWRRTAPKGKARPQHDLVIADAPPTGQIVPCLSAPATFGDLIRVGRPRGQARTIDGFLRERAEVLMVTTPEELAVTETLEACAAIEDLGMSLGPIVVNQVLPPAAPRPAQAGLRSLTAASAGRVAADAGLPLTAEAFRGARAVMEAHRVGERAQRAQRRRLADRATIELPFLFRRGFGADEVGELAGHLEELFPASGRGGVS